MYIEFVCVYIYDCYDCPEYHSTFRLNSGEQSSTLTTLNMPFPHTPRYNNLRSLEEAYVQYQVGYTLLMTDRIQP